MGKDVENVTIIETSVQMNNSWITTFFKLVLIKLELVRLIKAFI